MGEENEVSKEMQQLGSYSGFTGIDFSQMPVANLQRNNTNASESEAYPGWVYACGDGAVGVCAISFGEKQMQKASSDLCYGIYDQVAGYSMSYSQYVNDEEWGWSGENAFGVIDHLNTALDFSWLKVLIVVYVIVVESAALSFSLQDKKKRLVLAGGTGTWHNLYRRGIYRRTEFKAA